MTKFTDLGLAEPILKALAAENYDKPTPIQAQAIPQLLKGRDLLGVAQTGTGKTAAFALPILNQLYQGQRAKPRTARALILSPTRELANQIAESFRTYGRFLKLDVQVLFGGAGYGPQTRGLRNGADILVATPGRLIDHIEQGNLMLNQTEIFVLDEADQMLDMGFVRPIRKIVAALPKNRQTLFFSATMPKEMEKLAGEMLTDPARVTVAPQSTTAERVSQRVIYIEQGKKRDMLTELLETEAMGRTLIFTRTKHGADRLVKHLIKTGVPAAAIHGNKSQNARTRALESFKRGKTPILVATDVAARGIDIDEVTHVINYELPNVPESYVHRIGRTARAGAEGSAIAFCANDERAYLKQIEKITRQKIPAEDRREHTGKSPAEAQAAETPAVVELETEERPRQYNNKPRHQGGGKGKGGAPKRGGRNRRFRGGKPGNKGTHGGQRQNAQQGGRN